MSTSARAKDNEYLPSFSPFKYNYFDMFVVVLCRGVNNVLNYLSVIAKRIAMSGWGGEIIVSLTNKNVKASVRESTWRCFIMAIVSFPFQ